MQRLWYERRPIGLLILLLPLSLLFAFVVACRRMAYRVGVFRSIRVPRPVIVTGNITVGGTGKTPLVIWLADLLQSKGRRVGIVLRGYGGESHEWPRPVLPQTPSSEVGDEAVLLATRTGAIVVAGPDRVAAALRAIELGADVVLTDDGLQHYRLARDCEIAVVDEYRGLGNGWLLPAGPLREPASRLREVDLIATTRRSSQQPGHEAAAPNRITVRAHLQHAVSLATLEVRPLESFRNTVVHAVAGIGNPGAFFAALEQAGLKVDARPLPDHAVLTAADLEFADDAPVLMTEKDAVKCRGFADGRHWAVRLHTDIDAADTAKVSALLERVLRSTAEKR